MRSPVVAAIGSPGVQLGQVLIRLLQSLKERFAEQLPEKIEEIKALRKYVSPPRH